MVAQIAAVVGALALVAGLIWAFARQARAAGRLEAERDESLEDAAETAGQKPPVDPVPVGDEQRDRWRRLRERPEDN